MIAYAAKHPGEDPGMQGSDKSAFDTLLGRHEYRLAMEIAVSPADYANIALLAAIAKDTVTASSAIELFQRLSVLSPLVTKDASVACELKAGFVHVLLDDGVDVAPLIKDADEWLQAASSRLEMGAMLYWWDIVALKMVSHPQQPIKSFLDNNAELASPADQLFALSGGAAVAFGVGGDIALPLIQESMMLLAQAPDPLVRTYTLEFMARILGAHSTTTGCR
jgi:hypothetical protein